MGGAGRPGDRTGIAADKPIRRVLRAARRAPVTTLVRDTTEQACGYRAKFYASDNISPDKVKILRLFGAEMVPVKPASPTRSSP